MTEFKNGDKVRYTQGGFVYTYIGKGAHGHVIQAVSGNVYDTNSPLEPYIELKLEVGDEYTLHGARFIVTSVEHIGDYTRVEGVSLGLRTPKDTWIADSISGSTLLNFWTKVDNS